MRPCSWQYISRTLAGPTPRSTAKLPSVLALKDVVCAADQHHVRAQGPAGHRVRERRAAQPVRGPRCALRAACGAAGRCRERARGVLRRRRPCRWGRWARRACKWSCLRRRPRPHPTARGPGAPGAGLRRRCARAAAAPPPARRRLARRRPARSPAGVAAARLPARRGGRRCLRRLCAPTPRL
jgi:hypothetical protein